MKKEKLRFIPAGAGNTEYAAPAESAAAVYPRWRGEHAGVKSSSYQQTGLSPLARGTRCGAVATSDKTRFIPAGAGNTQDAKKESRRSAVYPRLRGEHPGKYKRSYEEIGLSPLARGTPKAAGADLSSHRFIPAGAGNT